MINRLHIYRREETAALAEAARAIIATAHPDGEPGRVLKPPIEAMEEGAEHAAGEPRDPRPRRPAQQKEQELKVIGVLKRKRIESRRSMEQFFMRGYNSPDEDSSRSGTPPSPASPTSMRRNIVSTTVIEEEVDIGYPDIPLTGREEPMTPRPGLPRAREDEEDAPAIAVIAAANEPGIAAADDPGIAAAADDDDELAAGERDEATFPPGVQHELAGLINVEAEAAAGEEEVKAEVKEEFEVITVPDSSSSSSASSHQAKRKREEKHDTRRPKRSKVPSVEEFERLKQTVKELEARIKETAAAAAAAAPIRKRPEQRTIIDFPAEALHVKYNKIEAALPLNYNEEFDNILGDADGRKALDMIVDNIIIEEVSSDDEERRKRWISKVAHTLFSNDYMEDYKVYDERTNYKQKVGTAMSKEIYDWLVESVTSTLDSQSLNDVWPWKVILKKLRDVFRYTRSNVKKRREEKEEKEKEGDDHE